MLTDLVYVFAYASVPVAAVSFLLIYWSISQGYLGKTEPTQDQAEDSNAAFNKEVDQMASDYGDGKLPKKPKNDAQHIFFEKWLTFGGGFYGVVALITYLLVEWDEVLDLFTGNSNIISAITSFDISFFINFFVESILNLVTAFTWPVYWMDRVDGPSFWVWLLAAWFGYEAGSRAARIYHAEKQIG